VKAFGLVTIFQTLPSRISRLQELAYNLWWSWHPEARALFSSLDPALWEQAGHNPVRLLSELQPQVLENAALDPTYLQQYDSALNEFDEYMHPRPGETWFSRTFPELIDHTVAYFSAEFGLDESLPIYSGGLGILSGDHAKEASDLDLPYVGVGILYSEGYFQQHITREGAQEALYNVLHFSEAPVLPVYNENGAEVMISVDLPGRPVYARLWKVQVGRIPLYLLDTDIPHNSESDRKLTAQLYGGDQETRISQEILLGIGGVRALRALGISPTAWHLNEGHAAFLNLERCRELVASGLNFYEAREAVEANSLFTTHTPVPAGNDTFGYDLIDTYFWFYWGQLGLTREQFIELAREDHGSGPSYGMTVLALRLTGQHNGVSKLHGAVARKMWQFLWPDLDVDEVPIDSITNGIHSPSWIVPEIDALYQRYVDVEWKEHVDEPELWNHLDAVPDEELWQMHRRRKELLIDYARQRLRQQYLRQGASPGQSDEFEHILNPNALTIGFARRFATYKRATLILRDLDRLSHILDHPERPVQIIFAGKAHPADEQGKALVEQVYHLSRSDEFRGTIIFLENYDIDMARYLVSGADLWLNNPIRPYEASGTSGQKAALNGLPNCSILDGWWAEGYNGKNGWAIGEEREYDNAEERDEADSQSLYALLEEQITPTYYNRGSDGIPHGWIAIMKEAIRTCAPAFSMRRMVKEYSTRFYVPEIQRGICIEQNHYQQARELAAWEDRIRRIWPGLGLYVSGPRDGHFDLGAGFDIHAWVRADNLHPEDVRVDLVYAELANSTDGYIVPQQTLPMAYIKREQDGAYRYDIHFQPCESGTLSYGVRVLPNHADLPNVYDLGLILWA
jgi:glycogen phosphorylase